MVQWIRVYGIKFLVFMDPIKNFRSCLVTRTLLFNWPNVSVGEWLLQAQFVWNLSLCKGSIDRSAETSVENPYIVCDEWVGFETSSEALGILVMDVLIPSHIVEHRHGYHQ